jgi:predicted DsbA family dithiol-disulfide isomerase
MEPAWTRIRQELGERLTWRYFMGGMIPNWDTFRDPLNAVHRPGQMGPHWMYVRSMVNVPIDERIWQEDPPDSSYPACLAVKAAARQGIEQAEHYLRRLREAVMTEKRNVSRPEVLIQLAQELEDRREQAPWDVARFSSDLDSEDVRGAFTEDLKDARFRGIGRFPTLLLLRPGGTGLILVGYRPYSALRAAIEQVMSDTPHPAARPVPG